MITEILENLIKGALIAIGFENEANEKILLEHPEELSNGDYSSNIAMVLAKRLAQDPRGLAQKIVEKIKTNLPAEIEKVETAGSGFINFYLSPKFFEEETKKIVKAGKRFGQNNTLNGQKTIIDYTDPNPFKEFHIGHLMTNVVGESLSGIMEASGAVVKRANYQGDVGIHVAKAIWGAFKMLEEAKYEKEFFGGWFGFNKNPKIWGQAYVLGATAFEQSDTAKKEITNLNKKIYDRSDKKINKLYDVGRKTSLQDFEKIYKILGTKFDYYFFESEVDDLGKEIALEALSKGYFEKSNGAIIFPGEKYDPLLHTRVFISSQGLPTYEAKELGLTKEKYRRFAFDKTIAVTGNEINDFYRVVKKAMELTMPDLAPKVVHIGHGMLRLPTGKMSSRTGEVITGESLLNEIKNNISEKMRDRKMSRKEKNKVAEIVAVGALKFSILKQVIGKDIIFDFDKSISFEGDSGPYLQYSYTRAESLLRKAEKEKVNENFEKLSGEILELEKNLYRFPETVKRAVEDYAPNYLVTYLTQIASSFNNFYAIGKIVDKNDKNSPYKIALTEAFSIVMKNGLNLLGIKVPEKM